MEGFPITVTKLVTLGTVEPGSGGKFRSPLRAVFDMIARDYEEGDQGNAEYRFADHLGPRTVLIESPIESGEVVADS